MGTLIAFTVGYVVGSKGGRKQLASVTDAIRDIRGSDEFRGLVMAFATHMEFIVQELTSRITLADEADKAPQAPSEPAWAPAHWLNGTADPPRVTSPAS